MTKEPVKIFLIEDDEGDVRITREAFEEGKLLVDILHFETADRALAEIKAGNIPDLILLDLNLPGMDGRELLQILKEDDQYKSIPVVILTTSKSDEDIVKSYQLHANAYITKPVDPVQFIMVARSIENFWFEVVKLPLKNTSGGTDAFKFGTQEDG